MSHTTPLTDETIVWVPITTNQIKKYHLRKGCYKSSKAVPTVRKAAMEAGLNCCINCYKAFVEDSIFESEGQSQTDDSSETVSNMVTS